IKHYPPEKYAKVIEMIIAEEPNSTFVILGGGQNDLNSAQILKQNISEENFSQHVIDLTNKTTYRQTAVILGFCDMYIGNDTGALHVAAAVKCPCLAVFPFPADLPEPAMTDGLRLFRPYKVPAVVVQPAHAIEACARQKNEPYSPFGCRVMDQPHCIAQIEPETIFKGFRVLKENISKNLIDTTYLF
ncbi:MAG: glycosyltransferase family 9 protein, partial [Selenomonadaceae bacterium]|nr:glycosyltransferase family 9 protein [Selenomonadaceae bacterium]